MAIAGAVASMANSQNTLQPNRGSYINTVASNLFNRGVKDKGKRAFFNVVDPGGGLSNTADYFSGGKILGGGSGDDEAPRLPSLTELADEYKAAYPTYFGMTQKYAPKEAQLQLDLLRNYGTQIAAAQKAGMEELYPYSTGLQEQLAQQASQGINDDIPDWMRKKYLSDTRATLGQQAASPIGADVQSIGLLGMQKQYQDYFRNLGYQLTSRVPLYEPIIPEYTNIHGGFTPSLAAQYTLGGYANTPALDQTGGGYGSGVLGGQIGNLLGGLLNSGGGNNTSGVVNNSQLYSNYIPSATAGSNYANMNQILNATSNYNSNYGLIRQ